MLQTEWFLYLLILPAMIPKKINTFKQCGFFLLFLGSLFIFNNILGLYLFRTVEANDSFVVNPATRKLSASEFWGEIDTSQPVDVQQFAERLTKAISERILFVSPDHAHLLHPTFFENWIIWLYSLNSGY
ncbi:MAG: hypothetical protein D3917_04825 [Candidatus Electrothrix sp. AX5]|nr:hypothetical protein [Candidatus Electrothrix sp. AX5]